MWAPIAAHAAVVDDVRRRLDVHCALHLVPVPTNSVARRHVAGLDAERFDRTLDVLVLTLAVATPPFAHVGRPDDQGNRYYRAYFTADFVWHTALTSEVGKFAMPPRNPYLARQPIHYYWTYYLLPAAAARVGPARIRDVQLCLKINALMTGLLLMSAVFLAAWTVAGRAVAVGVAARPGAGRVERGRVVRDWQAVAPWRASGRATELEHRRRYRLAAVCRSSDRRPAALPLVCAAALDGVCARPHRALLAAAAGGRRSLPAIILSGIALGVFGRVQPAGRRHFRADLWRVDRDCRLASSRAVMLRHAIAAVPVVLALIWCASQSDGRRRGRLSPIWFSWRVAPTAVRDAFAFTRTDPRHRHRGTPRRA